MTTVMAVRGGKGVICKVYDFLDAKNQLAQMRRELSELRSYVDKMDGIAEQIIEWGNECAACAAHYKEVSVRLKKKCDELESKVG